MICPALGSRNFVKRWKTVVLPAPFGPISAWIVPRRIFRSTPCTAVKPRNSFVRPRVSRMTSSTCETEPTGRVAGYEVTLIRGREPGNPPNERPARNFFCCPPDEQCTLECKATATRRKTMIEDRVRDDIAFIRRAVEEGRNYATHSSPDIMIWGMA